MVYHISPPTTPTTVHKCTMHSGTTLKQSSLGDYSSKDLSSRGFAEGGSQAWLLAVLPLR